MSGEGKGIATPTPAAAATPLLVMGVPEHFNIPVQVAESHVGAEIFKFVPEKGGTGAMISSLLRKEVDVAIALTEGIVAALVANPLLLSYCGEYVTSPLCWAIVTGAAASTSSSSLASFAAQPDKPIRVAISRLGSGSHIMAYVLAKREGWSYDRLVFTVEKDFRSMRRSVVEGATDFFLWEWFMTKPYMDSGELTPLGQLLSPWNCFGFVARKEWLNDERNRRRLQSVASSIFSCAETFKHAEDASCEQISAQFGIALSDAHAWFSTVSYAPLSRGLSVNPHMLAQVTQTLQTVGLITNSNFPLNFIEESLVDTRVCSLLSELHHPASLPQSEMEGNASSTPLPSSQPSSVSTTVPTHRTTVSSAAESALATDVWTRSFPAEAARLGAAHLLFRPRSHSSAGVAASPLPDNSNTDIGTRATTQMGVVSSGSGSSVPSGSVGDPQDVLPRGLSSNPSFIIRTTPSLPSTAGKDALEQARHSKADALARCFAHVGRFGGVATMKAAPHPSSILSASDATQALQASKALVYSSFTPTERTALRIDAPASTNPSALSAITSDEAEAPVSPLILRPPSMRPAVPTYFTVAPPRAVAEHNLFDIG